MPLQQQDVDELRTIWRGVSGKIISNEQAWAMATRLLCFFDAVEGLLKTATLTDRNTTRQDREVSVGDPTPT